MNKKESRTKLGITSKNSKFITGRLKQEKTKLVNELKLKLLVIERIETEFERKY